MKITIIQVGKTKESSYQEIEQEFLKRLRPYCDLQTITIKTSDQKTENQQIQQKIPKDQVIIALDGRGHQLTSKQCAQALERYRDLEGGKITFLIGGPHGLTRETLSKAKFILSFSKMTFTHQMVRLFLLEQLYRSFMILAGKSYHY
jgi:23S rRNA (pseudouridine1915-N3)-methyltransferase